jgi:hypothetical protein
VCLILQFTAFTHAWNSRWLSVAVKTNKLAYTLRRSFGKRYARKLSFYTLWFHLSFINSHSYGSTVNSNLLTCHSDFFNNCKRPQQLHP